MGICGFSSCSFPRVSETAAPARRGSQNNKAGGGPGQKRPSLKGSDKGKGSTASVKAPHRLSQVEIQERQDAALKSETLQYAGMKIKYAYVSQRGYYPDTPNKENQDSFLVVPSFDIQAKDTPKATAAFFGVFDGHGKDGHLCSRYVKEKVIIRLEYCHLSEQVALIIISRRYSHLIFCSFSRILLRNWRQLEAIP
jgi:hypothetical protein